MVNFQPVVMAQPKSGSAIRPRVGRGGHGWRWVAATAGGGSDRIGADLAKIDYLQKNTVLDKFLTFSDLLDLKNGSGSKFRF